MVRLPDTGSRVGLLLLATLFCVASASWGQVDRGPEFLTERFWVDLEPPVGREGDTYPLDQERAVRMLLEEARYVFGGMIYGFDFRYVPADRRRGVGREFDLEPVAEISFGDPRLSVVATRVDDMRLIGTLEYRTADFQRSRLAGWMSADVPSVGAEGEEPYWRGYDARIPAIENGIRQAVRAQLRKMTDNKPREARGSLVLLGSPRVYVRSGAYRARVDVKIKVDEIRPYEVY